MNIKKNKIKLTVTKENIIITAVKNIRNNITDEDGNNLWDKYKGKEFIKDKDLYLAISDILINKKEYLLIKMNLMKMSEIKETVRLFKEKYDINGKIPLNDAKNREL